MATQKKYFHDHFVLLLLSVNAFLALAAVIFILVRLSTGHGSSFIVQYRPSLGLNKFQTGSVVEIISFTVFALLIMVINTALSYRIYKIHRQLAVTILSLGLLLMLLTIIIGNALLLLR